MVILNELTEKTKLDANELERITHHLCYVYGRATKAVSICPPAYYAHLICLRARCYISDYVNQNWRADKEYDYNEAPWRQGVHERYVTSHLKLNISDREDLTLEQHQRLHVLHLGLQRR